MKLAVAALGLLAVGAMAPMHKRSATYAGDVAVILNAHCVQCHRPGEIAPFSLIGYQNAKKWSHMLVAVTQSKQMPPWKAVHGFGEFKDENRLTAAELETIQAWDKAGAPRGNPDDEPAAPTFASDWSLGKPDAVLEPSKPFKLPADGTDFYRNFVFRNAFSEDRWVTAMDVHPGNKRVVHHVIVFIDTRGKARRFEAASHDGQQGYTAFGGLGFTPSNSLGGWAPGLRPHETPTGTAFRVPAGADIVLQIHYHLSGKEETDQSKVGLYFAKGPVTEPMLLAWDFNFDISIPPGDRAYHAEYNGTLNEPIVLHSVMPHMHLLGKSMKAVAFLPDGKTVPLIYVDDWDFNWQMNYTFKRPIRLPAGTKIHIDAVFDNSADNPRNPNTPPKRVTFGEKTFDEMFLLIASYTVDR